MKLVLIRSLWDRILILNNPARHQSFATILMLGVLLAILTPYRVAPIPNFLPEVICVFFANVAAIFALLASRMPRQAVWGWAVACPLMLAAWLVVCIPFTRPPYPDALAFPVASLIAAAVAASSGMACRARQKVAAACLILSVCWIVASVGTAILQIVQLFTPERFEIWLFPRAENMQPFGNLAQRNHAACVHVLGLLSAAYLLWSRQKPYKWVLALCVLLSFGGLVMSGSRIGSVLGVIGVGAFVLLAPGIRKEGAGFNRPKALWLLALTGGAYLAAYLMGALIVEWTNAAQSFDGAVARWTTYGNVPRIALQELAVGIFLKNPLAGAGWGSFTAQSLIRVDELLLPQYANNSHNLFTHLAAEVGVVGLLIVVVPVSVVIVRAVRMRFQLEHAYLLLLCAVFLVYSMTEFPLWHTFFLLPFAFALGLLDDRVTLINLSKTMRYCLVAFYAVICVGAVYAVDRYINISRMTSAIFRPGTPSDELRQYVSGQLNSPGFSPQTELLTFGMINIDRVNIEQKIELGNRVVRQHIVTQMLFRQAGLYALNGQTNEAVAHVFAACRFYPKNCSSITADLQMLARFDEPSFAPVLQGYQNRVLEMKQAESQK